MGGVEVQLYSFLTTALEGGERSVSRLGLTLTPGKTRYPLYRRLGAPQGRSGQVRKISPSPGFDPRTVQPVAQSLYRLSYRAHKANLTHRKMLSSLSSHVALIKTVTIIITRFSSPFFVCDAPPINPALSVKLMPSRMWF